MAVLKYTKKAFIQRVRRHITNSRFVNDDFSPSDNEILYLIDDAIAFSLKGLAYENAKVEGVLTVPDAYYVTYSLSTLKQDTVRQAWYATLPQPPVSLPLGYSVSRVYNSNNADGISDDFFLIKHKRLGIRRFLPKPTGKIAWVENSKLYLQASDGFPLLLDNIYVVMATSRTQDVNEEMPVSDDAMTAVFDMVVKQLLQRYSVPQDVVKDDLPAGNKSS